MKKAIGVLGLLFLIKLSAFNLKGASQFDHKHAYNRGMIEFGSELSKCDARLNATLQGNSVLGVEKDYLNFMVQGNAVDYAIISPAHMANYSEEMSLLSMPFLFRDKDHWKRVLESDVFSGVTKKFEKKADVLVLGFAGGSIRNIISSIPVKSDQDLIGLKIRVQGAPVHAKIWAALGALPTVINYNEVYNAIQTGVIHALENGAAGLEAMKFYEVASYVGVTQHTISVRPFLFSGKTYRKLNGSQKKCVRQAGRKAAEYARYLESSEDQEKQDRLKRKGLVEVYKIADHKNILKKASSVKVDFAASVGAKDLLKAVSRLR